MRMTLLSRRARKRLALSEIQNHGCLRCPRSSQTFEKDQICQGGHGPVNARIAIVGITNPMPKPQQSIMDAVIAELDMIHLTYQTAITRCSSSLKPTLPSPNEARECFNNYLRKEITLIDPAIVVLLGDHVVGSLWTTSKPFKYGRPIFELEMWRRDRAFEFLDRRVLFPVRHPEDVIRKLPNALTDLISQLRTAKEFYLENFHKPT